MLFSSLSLHAIVLIWIVLVAGHAQAIAMSSMAESGGRLALWLGLVFLFLLLLFLGICCCVGALRSCSALRCLVCRILVAKFAF